MNIEQQKTFIAGVKAATHGMSREEKQKVQELMLAGACMVLKQLDQCPNEWTALLFLGRANKLFR